VIKTTRATRERPPLWPSPSPPLSALRPPRASRARYSYSATRSLPIPQVVRKRGGEKGVEWRTVRYRPLPGPLSIATPSRLHLRHAICATVGSWNFATPKIVTPARARLRKGGRNVEAAFSLVVERRGRENPGAARRLATSPFTLHRSRETERERERERERPPSIVGESCAHMADCRMLPHLYGVSPRTRASSV